MSTCGQEEYLCPICNAKFGSYTQYSYSIFGKNLDSRPTGPAEIPNPIHKCPRCNFVFVSEDFFTKKEIEKIKVALKTNNIFEKEPDMPKYYYLAREAEMVNRDLIDIIYYFLSAVWENYEPDKEIKLIGITIEYINKLKETDESYNNYQLTKLDLLRRSGQFNDAMKLIEKIKKNDDFYKDFIVQIIDLQIKLIGEKNQEEHPSPTTL